MIFDQLVRAQIDELARGASAIQAWVEQSEAFAQRASADRLAMESLAKTLTEPVKISSLARVFAESEAFAQRASADRLAMESLAKTLTEPVKVSSLARVFAESEAFAQRASADRLAMESLAKTLTESVKVSSLARVFAESEAFAQRASADRLAMESLAKTLTESVKVSSLARVALLTTNFGNLTRSYQSLLETASTHESLFKHVPFITTYAPVEYNREVEVLNSISVEDDDGLVISEVISKSVPSVDAVLANFDDRYCPLLQGARSAAISDISDNPDRERHVATSLRELSTRVLHALAPDDCIRQWSADKRHFFNKRPTRRARLQYIHRHINADPLTRFVDDDVEAALSLLDLLQEGTHGVEPRFTESQLRFFVLRIESLLVFLIQLRNTG